MLSRRFMRLLGVAAFAAVVVTMQVVASAVGRPYYLTQLIMSAYYTVVVLGLCLVMGYCGQISLGHGAFFAIGGYTSAILTTKNMASMPWAEALTTAGFISTWQNPYGEAITAFSPWAAFVTALLISALAALLIGYPALRLKGHYLAMATLGFGLIVYRLLLGNEFMGSADGITGVPPWNFGPAFALCSKNTFRVANYYFAWGFVFLIMILLTNMVRSRVGLALRAIHDGELAANAMGVHTAAAKLQVFVLSAIMAAAAGSLLTHYTGGIGPSEAGSMKSIRYVTLVAAGGMANLWGALFVSTLLTFLSLRGCFGSFDHAVFGLILIAIMSAAPEGPLVPLAMLFRRLFRRAAPPKTGRAHDPS